MDIQVATTDLIIPFFDQGEKDIPIQFFDHPQTRREKLMEVTFRHRLWK